ncbi:MAG TPA: prephenate dehydrogenase/arogenate dehydrogenase family protein, partial [Candidatus Limnocylindrales bacterium]|nr:prephenate dehydrogenase/arogenate dehydrogenase family protein [Candidatus Limnocylindrales bacterium]
MVRRSAVEAVRRPAGSGVGSMEVTRGGLHAGQAGAGRGHDPDVPGDDLDRVYTSRARRSSRAAGSRRLQQAGARVRSSTTMHVALLGLGLIGGSIARALRAQAGWTVAAWTPTGRGPEEARRAGVIERAAGSLDEAVDGADLVVLAAPPLEAMALLRGLAASGRDWAGITVTDVVSTKRTVTEIAAAVEVPFVGGHPMAGRETTGLGSSAAELFVDRPWVITEPVCGGDAAVVERLARACGAQPVHLDSAAHDRAVAAISHLPLLASVALVEAVLGDAAPDDAELLRRLAATGWRDMTRLARGDAAMGAGILATNAP